VKFSASFYRTSGADAVLFSIAMVLRASLVALALTAATAAPAAAAPELDPFPKPCYVVADEDQREFVPVVGRNFTPLQPVELYLDDIQALDTPDATWEGELNGSVPAPFVEAGQRVFTLRATEAGNLENSVTISGKVTRLSVRQIPRRAATSDRVRFEGRGFTEPGPVYAHYVYGGRSRKTVRIGMPTGDCGLFSVKRRQFPFKKSPRVGVWTIQFDQQRRYSPKARVRLTLTVRVERQVKRERARPR
jgi:hypothetical protein